MYVPQRVREAIDTALADEFALLNTNLCQLLIHLEKKAGKYVAEMIRDRFLGQFATARAHMKVIIQSRLEATQKEIQMLLTEEIEGRGEIIIIHAAGSPAHDDLLKITAVAPKAKAHRLSRLQGEFPRCEIQCLFALPFRQRLYAEKQIFSRLHTLGTDTQGSKWFEISFEFARKVLLDEKRAEDFREPPSRRAA